MQKSSKLSISFIVTGLFFFIWEGIVLINSNEFESDSIGGIFRLAYGLLFLITGVLIYIFKQNQNKGPPTQYVRDDIDSLHDKGLELFQRGDYNGALGYLNRAIIKNLNDSELYLDKGVVLVFLGKSKESLMYLDLALKFNPNFHIALKIRELIVPLLEKLEKRTESIGNLLETETFTKIKDLFQKEIKSRDW